MTLTKGWPGVLVVLKQASATTVFASCAFLAAILIGIVGISSIAILVAGLGAVTVALCEGALGVEQPRGFVSMLSAAAFTAVVGPILSVTTGLASALVLWKVGVPAEAHGIWMLLPGNVIAWFAVLAFAYCHGASVPTANNSAIEVAAVQSNA